MNIINLDYLTIGQAKELANSFETISFNHIYRNNNKRADELSNLALEIM